MSDTRIRQLERAAALGNWQDPVANAAYDFERVRLGEEVPPWQTSSIGWAFFIAHGEGFRVEAKPAKGNSVLMGRGRKTRRVSWPQKVNETMTIRFRLTEILFMAHPEATPTLLDVNNLNPLSKEELQFGVYGQTDMGNYFLLTGRPAKGSEFPIRWNEWDSVRLLRLKGSKWVYV